MDWHDQGQDGFDGKGQSESFATNTAVAGFRRKMRSEGMVMNPTRQTKLLLYSPWTGLFGVGQSRRDFLPVLPENEAQ